MIKTYSLVNICFTVVYGKTAMARKYLLKERAERQQATRQRIVAAAVELHTTLGPAHTSMMAIAERAGVERPTLYRHFPTMQDLYSACSNHHWSTNPPPDSESWLKIDDPEMRLRQALTEIYAYYSHHEGGIWNILRDLEDMPELRPFAANRVAYRARVRQILASAWAYRGPRRKRLTAALGHAVDFFAWRSLRRQGLTNNEAIELFIGLLRNI
jgi:AcrR family transcriptional regulator